MWIGYEPEQFQGASVKEPNRTCTAEQFYTRGLRYLHEKLVQWKNI